MSMREVTGRRLSTLMLDTDKFPAEQLIRVSIWVSPDDVLVTDDDPAKQSVRVEVQRGRTTIYGSVDREAWEEYEAKRRADKGESTVPWPTDGGARRPLEGMWRR